MITRQKPFETAEEASNYAVLMSKVDGERWIYRESGINNNWVAMPEGEARWFEENPQPQN